MDADNTVIHEDGTKDYVETADDNIIEAEIIVEPQPEKTEDSESDAASALFGN